MPIWDHKIKNGYLVIDEIAYVSKRARAFRAARVVTSDWRLQQNGACCKRRERRRRRRQQRWRRPTRRSSRHQRRQRRQRRRWRQRRRRRRQRSLEVDERDAATRSAAGDNVRRRRSPTKRAPNLQTRQSAHSSPAFRLFDVSRRLCESRLERPRRNDDARRQNDDERRAFGFRNEQRAVGVDRHLLSRHRDASDDAQKLVYNPIHNDAALRHNNDRSETIKRARYKLNLRISGSTRLLQALELRFQQ